MISIFAVALFGYAKYYTAPKWVIYLFVSSDFWYIYKYIPLACYINILNYLLSQLY